jgi:hypothetical protein
MKFLCSTCGACLVCFLLVIASLGIYTVQTGDWSCVEKAAALLSDPTCPVYLAFLVLALVAKEKVLVLPESGVDDVKSFAPSTARPRATRTVTFAAATSGADDGNPGGRTGGTPSNGVGGELWAVVVRQP